MKNCTLFLTLLIGCISSIYGQTPKDSVTMEYSRGRYLFYNGPKTLTMNEVVKIFQSDGQAFKEIRSAQATNTFATIIMGAGAMMIGWPIGNLIDGSKPEWKMAGIGVGLIMVSIPFDRLSKKKLLKAISLYNRDLKTSSIRDHNEFKVGLTQNGLGLTMQF